jgi:hypothetical protein
MNTKRLPEITMVACLIGLAAWWWWPVKSVPVKTPVVRAQLSPPNAETIPPEEAPIRAIIPAPPEVAVEIPTPTAFDPQADLSTALPDYIRLLQSGDYATLIQNYEPPDHDLTDHVRMMMVQLWQAEMQTPEGLQSLAKEIADLQFIQNSPPVISDNGARATYTLPVGSVGKFVIFVKVNGRWYMD